jgi:dTDP-4-dehydrorhamnose 3,5-epimerase
MERLPTRLHGPILLAPPVHGDARGFFTESYRVDHWTAEGVDAAFVQDNHSRSGRGVVRGMHVTLGPGQAKLVRCARGRIWDVVVDVRTASPTYGEWEGFELDDESMHQLYVPLGFAHGFCVLSDIADVTYKVSSYYDPAHERGFAYDDPEVGIPWPSDIDLQVSERDRTAPPLSALRPDLPF